MNLKVDLNQFKTTTRKEVKNDSVRIKKIVLDLHGVIVYSRMVVLFEYE